jgi:chondroitin AC lyase
MLETKQEENNAKNEDAMVVYINALATLTGLQPPSKEAVDRWLHGFSQGRFSDITYPPTRAGSHVAALHEHLRRIKSIANYTHHIKPEGNAYHDFAIKALHFYTRQDYQTSNWWERQIGLAKIVAESLVLLVERSTSSALNDCIAYSRKTTHTAMGQTGANQADFAYIQLLWSISGWKNTGLATFLDDTHAASDATSSLCMPVSRHGREAGEGISVDNSFSQHNPRAGKYSQLYAGSYGSVHLANIFKTKAILHGAFDLNEAAIRSLENYIVNGVGWFVYAKKYDFHVNGRAISRSVSTETGLAGWCRQLTNGTPAHPEALQEIIRRVGGDESTNSFYQGHRAYWVNDYMVHISPTHCLWAKVISSRTVGSESGNGENLKGYYMGCGSYFVSRHGNEYHNIQPLWDWQRLPGTTVEQVPNFNYPLIEWGNDNWGSDAFAGVISNGNTGIASMILTRKNVKHAKKTVMTLPDKSVFMGSDIDTSAANHAVYTSVNQCMLHKEVTIHYDDGAQKIIHLGKSITSNKITRVIHDGLRYDFSGAQTITVQAKTQAGRWRDINKAGSKAIVSGNVFSIWIEHAKGSAGKYHYEISSAETTAPASPTDSAYGNDAHVITDKAKKTAAAVVFSNRGHEISLNGVKIKSLAPAAFIARVRDDGSLELTMADLAQKTAKADFIFTWNNATSMASFPLPDGDGIGKSITYLVTPSLLDDNEKSRAKP